MDIYSSHGVIWKSFFTATKNMAGAIVLMLRGMFSFAIWNRDEKTLFCARDPFGIKPFYYTDLGGEILFGSEIKCFLEHPI